MAIGKLDFGFNSRSIVDPYSSLMEALGSRGAMAQALTAADTKQQRDIEEQRVRDKMDQEKIVADRNYELALEAEKRAKARFGIDEARFGIDEATFRANALLANDTPITQVVKESVRVPGRVTPENQKRIQELREEMKLLKPVPNKTNTLPPPMLEEKATPLPADYSTVPDDASGTLRGYLLDGGKAPSSKVIPGEVIAAARFLNERTGAESTKKKEIIKPISTKPVSEVVPKDTTPSRTVEVIQKEIDKLSNVKPQTVERSITRFTELDPNGINKRLTEQYKEVYGKEPSAYDKAAIGARAREEYKRLYDAQQDQKKFLLEEESKKANIEYMKALTNASRANSRSSSTSSKAYAEAQKLQREHKDGWDNVRTNAIKADFGENDILKFNRYANLMEQLNLPPAKGEAVLEAIKNQGKGFLGYFTDVEPTANAINSAVGDLQAISIDPITGRPIKMSLGDAIVEADKEGYRLTLHPQTGEIMLLK